MKIVADNKIPFLKNVFEPFCDIEYVKGNEIKNNVIRDVDVLIVRTITRCDEKLLKGTKVKFIATATIGYDHIDVEYCKRNNIKWINAPGCNSNSVKQWVMAALLSFINDKGMKLKDRTLGVIGIGNVGSKVVQFAESVGLRVLLNDPPRMRKEGKCGFVSLDTLLNESNIISIHVPLNYDGRDKTYGLVDKDFFKKIVPGTVLINTSRGEVINEDDLLKAISSNKLSGVLLDVWRNEPDISGTLMESADIATSHIAGYSADGKANGTTMVVQAVSSFLNLPLTDWCVYDLPVPEKELIRVDVKDKNVEEVLADAVLGSYPIMTDDANLRADKTKFQELRSNYMIRREPEYWKVQLMNDDGNYKRILKDIGFKII